MNDAALDLRLLQCFAALMAERSVTRAAAQLNLTQPAMSNALKRLRKLFGDPLLIKGYGGMTPTARALELEPQAQALLSGARNLVRRQPEFDPATARLRFVLMAGDYLEYLLAPRLAQRMQQEAPGIDLLFRPANRERALSWLESGEIDFRVGPWPNPPPSLRCTFLFRDRIVCLARKGHRHINGTLTTAQYLAASHIRVVTPHFGGTLTRVIDNAVAAAHGRRRVALGVQNAFVLADVVSKTDLVASVSQRFARWLAEKYPLQVLPLPLGIPEMRIALYWHERTQKQPAHRWLRDLIVAAAKAP